MIIKFYNSKDDSFWICCSEEETNNIIVPLFYPDKSKFEKRRKKDVEDLRKSEIIINMETEIYGYLPYAYFCISRDLSSCYTEVPHHPFHPLWNAYSPFEECDTIEIKSLEELKDLTPTINGEK